MVAVVVVVAVAVLVGLAQPIVGVSAASAQSGSLPVADCLRTGTVRAAGTVEGIVELAYCTLLRRPPDDAGARYWQEQLEGQALGPTDLVASLVGSEEFTGQGRAHPFETLARIERLTAPAAPTTVSGVAGNSTDAVVDSTSDGFRRRRELSTVGFDDWVADRGLHEPSAPTPAVVHGRLDQDQQRINVAYVHLSATRGLRVSPGDRGLSTVGTWAEEIGATVAINGNWFGPWDGPAVADGQVYAGSDHSYTALFGVTAAGDWVIQHHREINDSVDPRIVEAVAGHPTLVYRGTGTTDYGTDPTFLSRHPRSAIGVDESGDVLILVTVDGRRSGARGMTGSEMAVLMERLGAHDAVMLDGGGSTAMWIAGRGVVNQPSGGLRPVGNQVAVFGD